ncbi:hypothetical protein PG995_008229 [Apiospora arundinis]
MTNGETTFIPAIFQLLFAAHSKKNETNRPRAGGDWETGVIGYEERFCRRSTLSLTLSTPAPNSPVESNYPIPSEGCIYSGCVVVFRGPHEQYTKWEPENWSHLPVVSIPAARWPKLNQMGTKFAFDVEKELVRAKIRAALAACVYNGHNRVVIGNFGLGNSARNPARELAELWRDVFLYDPDFRGRFAQVCFVFEDLYESTTRLIFEDMSKKAKGVARAPRANRDPTAPARAQRQRAQLPAITRFLLRYLITPRYRASSLGRTRGVISLCSHRDCRLIGGSAE